MPLSDGGDHVAVDGMGALIDGMVKYLVEKNSNILLEQRVQKIRYDWTGCRVEPPSTFEADLCIVTTPLGVLQQQPDLFDPPLSREKQQVLARAGLGVTIHLPSFGSDSTRLSIVHGRVSYWTPEHGQSVALWFCLLWHAARR